MTEYNAREGPQGPSNTTDFIMHLIEVAKKGEHNKIDFVKSPVEFRTLLILYSANTKIVKACIKIQKKLMQEYLQKLKNEIDDVSILLTYRTFINCVEFYEEEKNMAKDKLIEYISYINSGHFFDTFILMQDRTTENMFDHRYGK